MELDMLDRALVVRWPALIKAVTPDSSGRRIVECESSTEVMDMDGDVVMQKALLDSAEAFIATGHLDIDHKSELGHRMIPPIADPSAYIVGRPLEVRAAEGGRTFVKGEIDRARDGAFDPNSHADALWASLMREPPVKWYASIYGFPTDLDDCTRGACGASPAASRFVIKAIDWRSLAFTRTPKNTALSSPTRIVTAKAYVAELMKSAYPEGAVQSIPQTMDDAYAAADCPGCRVQEEPSLLGYRQHFEKCRGYPTGAADVMAHALMHKCNMDKAAGVLRRRNKDGVLA
jgi:hypothetical protein